MSSLHRAWNGERRPTGKGPIGRAAVVLPTGMGKTVIFAELIRLAHERRTRPLLLVHREELIRQAEEKIHSASPHAAIGVIKAGRNEVSADILIGSIQTLGRYGRRTAITNIGMGIVDECHHAVADTYRDTMAHFGAWHGIPWAGFTATMSRSDPQSLGEVWQEIVLYRDITDGIREGHLVNVRGKRIHVNDLTLSKVRLSQGDYLAGELGDALIDADAGNAIAKAYVAHASDRQGIVFAPTVQTAEMFAGELNNAGVITEVVSGSTPTAERADIYERLRTGVTRVVSNCMVLTEGFDAPWVSCIVIARPTQSTSLYVQMIGRALRPWPQGGKRDALVLDVVGASERNHLATLADLAGDPEVEPQDGESLTELVRRIRDTSPVPEDNIRLAGDVVAHDVDLFAQSDTVWLQTIGGVWFVPTKTHLFFLWPTGGTFTLGKVPVHGGKAEKLESDLSLGYGMAWAEAYADEADTGFSVAKKGQAWRQGRTKPAPRQIQYASSLGIPTDGLSKRELSDMISVNLASRVIDR